MGDFQWRKEEVQVGKKKDEEKNKGGQVKG